MEGVLRLIDGYVSCGFPSPALDYLEDDIDLLRLLTPRPSATFFIRAKGDSMKGAGILDGAILIIDRSLTAQHSDIVLAVVQGEFTVKYWMKRGEEVWLHPANSAYKPVQVNVMEDVWVWGVITWFINKSAYRNRKRLS